MIHGLFENTAVRASLLSWLRRRKGIDGGAARDAGISSKEAEYDRLEAVLRNHIDCDLLRRIAKL